MFNIELCVFTVFSNFFLFIIILVIWLIILKYILNALNSYYALKSITMSRGRSYASVRSSANADPLTLLVGVSGTPRTALAERFISFSVSLTLQEFWKYRCVILLWFAISVLFPQHKYINHGFLERIDKFYPVIFRIFSYDGNVFREPFWVEKYMYIRYFLYQILIFRFFSRFPFFFFFKYLFW